MLYAPYNLMILLRAVQVPKVRAERGVTGDDDEVDDEVEGLFLFLEVVVVVLGEEEPE